MDLRSAWESQPALISVLQLAHHVDSWVIPAMQVFPTTEMQHDLTELQSGVSKETLLRTTTGLMSDDAPEVQSLSSLCAYFRSRRQNEDIFHY